MATRISDLTALASGLKKNDKFEMCKTDEGKSYSCTPEDILNYCKDQSNGAFRGNTTEDLDNMNENHIGVWQWMGSGGPNGLTSGLVEIISQKSAADTAGDADLIQRISFGGQVFQRDKIDGGVWTPWSSLKNVNGCKILYNVSNTATVKFSSAFSGIPSVVCIPLNTNAEEYAYVVNVTAVSASEFTVVRYKSGLATVKTTETTTVNENTQAGTKTTTTTYVVERGEWEAADFSFYWIALHEEG